MYGMCGLAFHTRLRSASQLVGDHRHSPPLPALVDRYGRAITYLRVSVTDRCDFRCVYCMSEHMSFLPRADLLTLEELDRLCIAFVARGVRKLRITGGEPLVRKNIIWLFQALSRHLRRRRARRADADDQRQPAQALCRRSQERQASSASTSRSTRCDPTVSAPSPAGAISRPSCRGSTRPTPPASRSRSTPLP